MRIFPLLILIFLSAPVLAAEPQPFSIWLENLRRDARAEGISESLIHQALPDSLSPDDRIIRLDRKQPEGGISFEKYKSNVVTPVRLKVGREKLQEHRPLLEKVGAVYGVESHYVVALWGIETSFGRNTGGFEIIPALVTLAYEGRRGEFFRKELLKALHIIDQGHVELHQMKGSWAGAMGQCQFMPTSFEKYARDFDGDGRRDIWGSEADIFASISAYLAESGWRAGQPWGHKISLPKDFDINLIGVKVQKPLQFWRDKGIIVSKNEEKSFFENELLSVVQPGGEGYKAYLVGNNYRILLKWNTSSYFATAVGFLADGMKS